MAGCGRPTPPVAQGLHPVNQHFDGKQCLSAGLFRTGIAYAKSTWISSDLLLT